MGNVNENLNEEQQLRQWKLNWEANVLPLTTLQSANNNNNTISLLPILSKILEKIGIKKLQLIINTKDIILSHQFGFRAG